MRHRADSNLAVKSRFGCRHDDFYIAAGDEAVSTPVRDSKRICYDAGLAILCCAAWGVSFAYAQTSLTGSSLVLKSEWMGDANGNGVVTSADLSLMSVSGTSWQAGDFNYDKIVNADDFALFAPGAGTSHGESINSVPEPRLRALAGALVISFARKRKEGFFR